MLSVCIPHYNFQNPLLLKELEKQCEDSKIVYEIIIVDDASNQKHKSYLKQFTNKESFTILYLEKNIGRSKIRNLLIKQTSYDLLLFLDGDSGIDNDDFIKIYLDSIKNNDLIYGGRKYNQLQHNNCKLHWLYGSKTESVSDKNFHSNNFLIQKQVLNEVSFDESLSQYGYEDVVFGVMVKLKGFKMQKIDNPVIHLQLKSNKEFLDDTVSALKNIKYLYENKPELINHLNLSILNFYLKLKKLRLHHLMNWNESFITNYLYKQLVNNKSGLPLSVLKLYKMYVLNQLITKKS